MKNPTITGLTTRLLTRPLPQPWAADVTELHVIATDLTFSDGSSGHGFTWTPTIGAHAVKALLDHDIKAFIKGRSGHPETLWQSLWEHLHEAGGGGITTIAMAGVDLALWDAHARRNRTSVTSTLGTVHPKLEAYGSGVNLHYSDAELKAQVERWRAYGYRAIKIKVGSPDLNRDLRRLASVREIVGSDIELMVDANQRWDLAQARRALTAFAEFAPAWIEEPLRANDLAGHRALRETTAIPFALGENLHTIHQFRDFITAGCVDVAQPNIVRVGGITPFRRIASLAHAHSVQVAPHLLTDLSALLGSTMNPRVRIEEVEGASFGELGFLAVPSPIARTHNNGRPTLTIAEHTGLGLTLQ